MYNALNDLSPSYISALLVLHSALDHFDNLILASQLSMHKVKKGDPKKCQYEF